jgi:streptogramin lyase
MADGQFTDFQLSSPTSRALAITAGPDGNLWFTEADESLTHFFDGKIGRITPDGTLSEFDIPRPHAMYPGTPAGITLGPDGNIWFTEPLGNTIGRITPDGTLTEFQLSTSSADPDGITVGPDGNLWFTEANQFTNGNKIGRITPDGAITEFPLPVPLSLGFTEEIVAGTDGNLWFPEAMRDQIGRITPDGTISEFPLPTPGFDPQRSTVGITAGPDGNVWFTEFLSNQIGQITPDGSITEFPVPDGMLPGDITTGPDGNLWFTEHGGQRLGEFILNDGTRPAAARSAAVDALFIGTRAASLPGVIDQKPLLAASDGTVSSRDLEALTPPPAQPGVVDFAILPNLHDGHRAVPADVAGLADALVTDL